jgi:predicted Na+-dependent transporter
MMAPIFGGIVFIWIHYQFNIPEEKSVALYFSSNMKNLGIALLIGSFVYSDPHTITTIIIYFLLQQISSALISDYVS